MKHLLLAGATIVLLANCAAQDFQKDPAFLRLARDACKEQVSKTYMGAVGNRIRIESDGDSYYATSAGNSSVMTGASCPKPENVDPPFGYTNAALTSHLAMDPKDLSTFCVKPVRDTVYLLQPKTGERQKSVGFYHLRKETVLACLFKVDCFNRMRATCQKSKITDDCFTYAVEGCTRENGQCAQVNCQPKEP